MKPLRLYLKNFMCYSDSYIDFSQFNLALIVGKLNNNDLYSNGVGKSTIFKAIEYVLFNQTDLNLDKIILDNTSFCKVIFDFSSNGYEYRIVRSRSRKGITDISFLKRNTVEGSHDEVYCDDNDSKYWQDLSGRRSSDTEKEISKIIKTNFNAFRSTQYFVQNDFNGLNTATPAKRKSILKEALYLNIYSRLEKTAKEKANSLSKDIDKHKVLIDNLENQIKDIDNLKSQLIDNDKKILQQQLLLDNSIIELNNCKNQLNDYNNQYSILQNKFSNLILNEKSLVNDKIKLENSITEYQSKKNKINKEISSLIEEINLLNNKKESLLNIDFSQINSLSEKISLIKDEIIKNNINIQNNLSKYEELKIPVPNDNICKHCRQLLTDAHKDTCKRQIAKEMNDCQCNIKVCKNTISQLNCEANNLQKEINKLNQYKQQLEEINKSLYLKDKDLSNKKLINNEYIKFLENSILELENKNKEIIIIKNELNDSYINESVILKQNISDSEKLVNNANQKFLSFSKEINHLSNICAILKYNIEQKEKDIIKCKQLKNNLQQLENKFELYPLVVQAFSSTGIPNLIIQNVLDDLQIEANNLLSQLKPGLQLSFLIEKTKGDGTQDDTLEIDYIFNGKNRDYDQLSGAMKLAVMFSLKLGLAFLLQKMLGTEIKFLLLDEIDQSLDKASVDAFADIVKFFQKDFTILIITHNDRLKDKFNNTILVNQNINGISKAQVNNN
jgi:DNA repair exonuclease SbcCD ATPase subunit